MLQLGYRKLLSYPIRQHTYGYSLNNPSIYIDPDGRLIAEALLTLPLIDGPIPIGDAVAVTVAVGYGACIVTGVCDPPWSSDDINIPDEGADIIPFPRIDPIPETSVDVLRGGPKGWCIKERDLIDCETKLHNCDYSCVSGYQLRLRNVSSCSERLPDPGT